MTDRPELDLSEFTTKGERPDSADLDSYGSSDAVARQNLCFQGDTPPAVVNELSRYALIYAILGLVLGLVCVLGGMVLFLVGVTGTVSWTARFLGAASDLYDAAPGAVLFLVGLFVVLVTRYKVVWTRGGGRRGR